ncbi:hypothetical protein ACOTDF_02455 [Achromobacter insuavis]|uniref:hypothetical protein n=1 Tax=Achromobacter insuavis TaxID=1287735 RepID=UPI003B9D8084
MSGANQHHLPQMLQRGFQAKGARGHTWVFKVGGSPALKRIDSIGADEFFYSEPSANGEDTLDDRITTYESERLGVLLHNLKKAAAAPAPQDAAEIVAHFAVRSGHFRRVMTGGITALGEGAAALLAEPGVMFRLFGFDQEKPSERFTSVAQDIWDDYPQLEELGIPKAVIIRMMLVLGRESFGANSPQVAESLKALGDHVKALAGHVVRSAHNKALAEDFLGGARKKVLETFVWELTDVPQPGVILPDCGVIAITSTGEPLPLMLADLDKLVGVVAPISARRLLLGRKHSENPFDMEAINGQLAACSDEFFIAASEAQEFVALLDRISRRSRVVIDEALIDAFKDYESGPYKKASEQQPAKQVSSIQTKQESFGGFGYQITFSGCGDGESIQPISEKVQYLVSTLSALIPLSRLDGITFAADYSAALMELDRGMPGIRPPTTIAPSEGVGIAQAPLVMRDGIVKVRVIAQASVGLDLVSQNDEHITSAAYILAHQLALVALVHYTDSALPGTLLQPVTGALNQLLYGVVSAAPDSYFAGRFSAPYAPDDMTEIYRELVLKAHRRLQEVIPSQRLAYRFHRDMDCLLEAILPLVRSFLNHAATMAGHCAGLEPPLAVAGAEWTRELERGGLGGWLVTFQDDLEKFADRIGEWQSSDEFYNFTKHAERVLWQFQIIPWEKDNGEVYVTIPLAVDVHALQLIEATTAKAVKSQSDLRD